MPTFTSNPRSSEWTLKAEGLKTVGSTVHVVESDENATLLQALTWFQANVLATGGNYPGTTGGTLPCRSVEPKFIGDSRRAFKMTCEFDSTVTAIDNPLSAPTEYEYDAESFEEAFYEDNTPSTPVKARHTNGVRFSELPTRQNSIRLITVTKNVAASNTMANFDGFQDTVNNASATIDGVTYTARTLFVDKVSLSKTQTSNGVSFKVLTTKLKAKKTTWDLKYESMGVQELVSGSLKPILVDDIPIEEPWPLQSSGAKAAALTDAGHQIVMRPYVASSSITAIT